MHNIGVGRKWASFMTTLMLLVAIPMFSGIPVHQRTNIRAAENWPRICSRHRQCWWRLGLERTC